eukprot:gene5713-33803_t
MGRNPNMLSKKRNGIASGRGNARGRGRGRGGPGASVSAREAMQPRAVTNNDTNSDSNDGSDLEADLHDYFQNMMQAASETDSETGNKTKEVSTASGFGAGVVVELSAAMDGDVAEGCDVAEEGDVAEDDGLLDVAEQSTSGGNRGGPRTDVAEPSTSGGNRVGLRTDVAEPSTSGGHRGGPRTDGLLDVAEPSSSGGRGGGPRTERCTAKELLALMHSFGARDVEGNPSVSVSGSEGSPGSTDSEGGPHQGRSDRLRSERRRSDLGAMVEAKEGLAQGGGGRTKKPRQRSLAKGAQRGKLLPGEKKKLR